MIPSRVTAVPTATEVSGEVAGVSTRAGAGEATLGSADFSVSGPRGAAFEIGGAGWILSEGGGACNSGISSTKSLETQPKDPGNGRILLHSARVRTVSTLSPRWAWPTMLKFMPAPDRRLTFSTVTPPSLTNSLLIQTVAFWGRDTFRQG